MITDKKPPSSWPSEGAIMFDHLYLRYAKAEAPVLKDLNFSIEAKEKVNKRIMLKSYVQIMSKCCLNYLIIFTLFNNIIRR